MTQHLALLLLCAVYSVCQAKWTREVPDYPTIQDCHVTSVPASDLVALLCRLRTINSEIDATNFSVIPPLDTVKLQIECSDVLFFQSALQNKSFYHLNKLQELDIQFCKIGEVPKEAFLGLNQLRNLTLRTFNTDWSAMSLKIAPDAFKDQELLENLNLGDNNIWTLPPKLFCNLDHLTKLNLAHNKLQNIANLSFGNNIGKCSPKLRFLDLSRNNFIHLPSYSFEALKNLTVLNMSSNGIRDMSEKVFFGMYSLQLLDVSGNSLATFPPELFKENKRMTKLYLQNNSLAVLAPGLFTGLDMLLHLDLSHNELTNTWVNIETFMDLISLATLNLSHNKINRLDMATFRDLTNLQLLNLQFNHIEHIADNTFSGLRRLHTLILSENKLVILGGNTLNGLTDLTEFKCDKNELASFDQNGLRNSTKLKIFDASGNFLRDVPRVVTTLPKLENLDLSNNLINQINGNTFHGLENLVALSMQDNRVEAINGDTFQPLINLQVLNLANNKIKHIQNGAFENNKNLKAIRVDDNMLNNVHRLFSNLTNLRWLNLSRNHIDMFDYFFIPIQLEYLVLSYNSINVLGNHFKNDSQLHLKMLDASFNKLRDISVVPDSVEQLFLNSNLISKLHPYIFFKKKNLTRVDLSSNRIRSMEENSLRLSILEPDSPVPEFYLADNPFVCDCSLSWLQTVNVQIEAHQSPRVVDLTSIKCQLLSRRGASIVPLLEVQKLQFLCQYESYCFPLCHCCEFDACDCEMTCPRNCSCFHDDSWSTNIVDCSETSQLTIPERIPMHASEVYLDGNRLSSLSSHTFIGRTNLRVLYLNNSNVNYIYNRTFNGLRKLKILYLNDNNLTSLKGYEFEHLNLLKELYLQNNNLLSINNLTFHSLLSLVVLRLDGNQLTRFSLMEFSENLLLNSLHIGRNQWRCECSFLDEMREWLEDSSRIIKDLNDFYCFQNTSHITSPLHVPSYNGSCGTKNLTTNYQYVTSHNYLVFPTISLGVCSLLLIVILIVFCNRNRLRIWVYAKYGVRFLCRNESVNDHNKMFDAFVSYSSKDEVFVTQILAPELERGSPSYKLCLHYRDFPVGSYISDTIVGAVDTSRRTIIVLSENFIKSEWSSHQFRSAHHEVLRDRKKRLIVILLGEVPHRDLDPDLQLYLKTNTFLKWGDKRFWEKLKFAMPDAMPPTRVHQLSSLNPPPATSPAAPQLPQQSPTQSLSLHSSQLNHSSSQQSLHQQQLHHHHHHHHHQHHHFVQTNNAHHPNNL